MKIKPSKLVAAILAGATLAGCAASRRLSERDQPARFHPSPEQLQSAESGDAEACCLLGWRYLSDRNYTEAAKWLLKSGNINSTGAAGQLLVEGRGVAQNLPRGIKCLRRGAEFPNIGGYEECALDLARLYEKGELVPRNDSEAYYFFGICVAKCRHAERSLETRPQLVAHQRAVGARLKADERNKQAERLRKWLDNLKAGSCRSLGELDSETTDVSVYLDDEDEVSFTVSRPATLLSSGDIAVTQLGKRLKELNVPDNVTIRIYASVDLSPKLRVKVHKALVNEALNFSRYEFFQRTE
ncbi:MAG: hypothetical protein DME24_06600 [Verrucomicrobia bacterium]|nr:MAG: hypothetical protein DME24_06600 [Verrucomicrobiota bacterium]